MDRARMPQLAPGSRHPDWQRVYERAPASALPWHSPVLDPDVAAELRSARPAIGTVLDLGCGLGSQAAALTAAGYRAVGTDVAEAAVARARSLYPGTEFLVDDITRTQVAERFHAVVDRGCFHVLEPADHAGYLRSLHRLLRPGGLFVLKVLSRENEELPFGPLRFSLADLHRVFGGSFRLLKARRTVFQGSTERPPAALLAVMRRGADHE